MPRHSTSSKLNLWKVPNLPKVFENLFQRATAGGWLFSLGLAALPGLLVLACNGEPPPPDQKPPGAPCIWNRVDSLWVHWDPRPEPDLAGYIVGRSPIDRWADFPEDTFHTRAESLRVDIPGSGGTSIVEIGPNPVNAKSMFFIMLPDTAGVKTSLPVVEARAGASYYSDRSYVILTPPGKYSGWLLIQSRNDEKSGGAVFFRLNRKDSIRVALAFDTRVLAPWLDQWAWTGTLAVSDTLARFGLYETVIRSFGSFDPGVYLFAVQAQDSTGNLSPWSKLAIYGQPEWLSQKTR